MKHQEYYLLQKFLLNKCNQDEVNQVFEILQTQKGMEAYKTLVARMDPEQDQFQLSEYEKESKELVFGRLKRQIIQSENKLVPKTRNIGFWVSRAAVLLLFLTLSFAFYKLLPDNRSTSDFKSNSVVALNTKSNPSGKKSKIHLPDGSIVWLNSSSQLSYPEFFANEKREIWLEGEAFFEVTRDEERPFMVHTGRVTTKVLGTSFNINSFENEDNIAVSVVTGKVQVIASDSSQNSRDQRAILIPGEMASFHKEEETIKVGKVDASQIAMWKDKTLLFDKDPFSKVLFELERWYGVEIENQSPQTNRCIIQGKYHNESLDNVLISLQYALGFEYEIDSRSKKIVIKGGNCQNM
ncbi:FecR domain-containing protein [Echinicola sp. CAU 1574]|uniref:FecR domain-containing protein n=1 Tax=Echinicola arenosa TaxID=2774144 RepID=A0ABR9AHT2_9BACT|nr:FecR domain-containing protein [Echinicola arenosa]MBD8488399.1 FecR domain-containing protein [Echinicola arenosa]